MKAVVLQLRGETETLLVVFLRSRGDAFGEGAFLVSVWLHCCKTGEGDPPDKLDRDDSLKRTVVSVEFGRFWSGSAKNITTSGSNTIPV